uniref:Ovule protein n=1 Tax=Caenorhabditis tropicalis TaxID=1561998 RepID=A0A1I7U596_9PELO
MITRNAHDYIKSVEWRKKKWKLKEFHSFPTLLSFGMHLDTKKLTVFYKNISNLQRLSKDRRLKVFSSNRRHR